MSVNVRERWNSKLRWFGPSLPPHAFASGRTDKPRANELRNFILEDLELVLTENGRGTKEKTLMRFTCRRGRSIHDPW